MDKINYIPNLRFPDFFEKWNLKKFGSITERVSIPVDVKNGIMYQQIGIRSHGKGIFHKEFIDGKELGNKRVFWIKENLFIVNIVFAWERAVAKTTDKEIGMIASHRFPMYEPLRDEADLNYLLYFFLTKKGKSLLELASPGGAGRNKTLGQKELENLKLIIPEKKEQQKIASFLTAVDDKLQALKKKKSLLDQYKKGVMQKIFSQELRFKDTSTSLSASDDGKEFPNWEVKKLGEVLKSISTKKHQINSTEFRNLGAYKVIDQGQDLIAGYSDLESKVFKDLPVIVFGDHTTILKYIDFEFIVGADGTKLLKAKSNNDLIYIFYNLQFNNVQQQGYKRHFTLLSEIYLQIPSLPEQTKIANFLSAIDEKINLVSGQIEKMEVWKKGLLQRMFV